MSTRKIPFLVGLVFVICAGAASAQIPVTDVAAITNQTQQFIQQYANMVQQLTQLQNQLEQAKQQYAALTGTHGMSNLLNEAYQDAIPTDWRGTLASMNGGSSMSSLAQQISSEASHLNQSYFGVVDPKVVATLQSDMDGAATGQAANAQIYNATANRYERVQQLMGQIDQAQDLKSINDLQARIQIENSMMQNQLLQVQTMNAMRANADQVKAQQARQDEFIQTTSSY